MRKDGRFRAIGKDQSDLSLRVFHKMTAFFAALAEIAVGAATKIGS
jgi:hypothetical protein